MKHKNSSSVDIAFNNSASTRRLEVEHTRTSVSGGDSIVHVHFAWLDGVTHRIKNTCMLDYRLDDTDNTIARDGRTPLMS